MGTIARRFGVGLVGVALTACAFARPDEASIKLLDDEALAERFSVLEARRARSFGQLKDVGESGSATGQLINGTPVDPKLFPAVLRMTTGGTCTASLIGPATVILAAHCVDDGDLISFKFGAGSVRGICEHAPGYDMTTHEQDWALCLLDKKVTGIVYERVDIEEVPKKGTTVALTGFGCTKEGGPSAGKLLLGIGNIAHTPPDWEEENAAIYVHSNVAAGGPVLCPGDSGGPLFITGENLAGPRRIVGINSRTTYEYGVSIFAAVASVEGRAFIERFAAEHSQSLCGVNMKLGCK